MIHYMNDSEGVGIVVSDVRNRFVIGRTRGPRVFNNFDVAKVMCNNILIPTVSYKKYYIQIPSLGIRKSVNDCQRFDDHYDFFFNNELHQVVEKNTRKAFMMGYLIFEDADQTRLDNMSGVSKLDDLKEKIVEAAEDVFQKGSYIRDFDVRRREICIGITGSTTKIHIFNVSKIMDINQDRRSNGLRCFPYRKILDKYRSFYVMVEKDSSESRKTKSAEKANEVVNSIIERLRAQEIEVRYDIIEAKSISFEKSVDYNSDDFSCILGIEEYDNEDLTYILKREDNEFETDVPAPVKDVADGYEIIESQKEE